MNSFFGSEVSGEFPWCGKRKWAFLAGTSCQSKVTNWATILTDFHLLDPILSFLELGETLRWPYMLHLQVDVNAIHEKRGATRAIHHAHSLLLSQYDDNTQVYHYTWEKRGSTQSTQYNPLFFKAQSKLYLIHEICFLSLGFSLRFQESFPIRKLNYIGFLSTQTSNHRGDEIRPANVRSTM